MPARKSYWEKPEKSPASLVNFPNRTWFSHHAKYYDAAKIIREGLRNPFGTTNELHIKLVRAPLEAFGKQAEQLAGNPNIRFLVSTISEDRLKANDRIAGRNYYVVQGPIQPSHFAAVILPYNQKHISNLLSENRRFAPKWLLDLLETAKERGIPVYTRFGKRLWPPVPE